VQGFRFLGFRGFGVQGLGRDTSGARGPDACWWGGCQFRNKGKGSAGFLTLVPTQPWGGRRRWSSSPSGKCSYERPTRGTVCGTMRSMCGADASCLAINYQYLVGRARSSGAATGVALSSSAAVLLSAQSLVIQKSTSLRVPAEYEPSSEPFLITAKCVFLHRELYSSR